ncbi:MAG: DtxR family transcriptional regulator [Planctomycetes bacterium]|nr:DtxR family transcriptional regulator [Planctomycetota bacterium]
MSTQTNDLLAQGALRGVVLAAFLFAAGGAIAWLFRALPKWWRRFHGTRRRVLAEDALKHVHHCGLRGHPASLDSLVGILGKSRRATVNLIVRLEAQDWLNSSGGQLTLTPEGERLALQVIRAHRLWERYLVDEARMPLAHVHAEAERREHMQSAGQLDALDAAMGHPISDPHGDPIPTSRGELEKRPSKPITDWPPRTPARIVHLEDEPPAVFDQIVALGFRLGQVISIVQADTSRIMISDGEETHVLAPIVAANIFVSAVEQQHRREPRPRLTALQPGQRATVDGLDETLQGFTRRRLLDLGLTPGASISRELSSVFRDPVAYRVRGSLIALRREQAEQVLIKLSGPKRSANG